MPKKSKKFRYYEAVLVYDTYSSNSYDRSTGYVSNYDPFEQSPRTSYNTNYNTADYARSNRDNVTSYSNSGGTYLSSNSSYSYGSSYGKSYYSGSSYGGYSNYGNGI